MAAVGLTCVDFVDSEHSEVVNFALHQQRETGALCDVVFSTGSHRFKAHRCILATKSEYFKCAEFRRKRSTFLNVNTASPDSIKQFLAFCYLGTVNVSPANVDQLLWLANSFGVSRLKSLLANYLMTNFNAKNIFGVYKLAETYGLADVMQHIDHFFRQNTTEILTNSSEALIFPFETVNSMLNRCRQWAHPSVLLQFVKRWISYSETERAQYQHFLLSTLDVNNTNKCVNGPNKKCLQMNGSDRAKSATRVCRLCGQSLDNLQKFQLHYKEVHNAVDFYECGFCSAKFTTARNLNNHIKRHFLKSPFRCPVCNCAFETLTEIVKHLSDNHSSIKGVEQAVSDTQTQTALHEIDKSLRKKNGKCSRGVVGVKQVHRCSYENCSYWTHRPQSLKLHQMIHSKQRPYVCAICNKSFVQRPHLSRHEWTHSALKPLKCKFCTHYSTARQDKLKDHIRRVHKEVYKRLVDAKNLKLEYMSDGQLTPTTINGDDQQTDNNATENGSEPTILENQTDEFNWNLPLADTDFLYDGSDQIQRPFISSPLSFAGESDWLRGDPPDRLYENTADDSQPRCFSLPPQFDLFDDCFDL